MNAAPAEPAAPSPAPGGPAPKGSPKARAMTRAAVRLALPFLLWLGVMMVSQLMHLTPSSLEASKDSENIVEAGASVISDAGLYALRTGLTLLALLVLRPWKYFPAPRLRNLPAALAVGVLVFALWVVPGADWFRRLCPALADLYENWCVRSPGELRDLAAEASRTAALYAPSATGWPLFAVHMLGTGVAIALAEEFFWRGYLLRAARTPDFLDLPIGEFHALSFLAVTAFFAAEHAEYVAGFAAGLAYGLLYLRTRDVWAACAAHAATNLLLGAYVLTTGHWEFW